MFWTFFGPPGAERPRELISNSFCHFGPEAPAWPLSPYRPRNPEKFKDTKKWLKSDFRGPDESDAKVLGIYAELALRPPQTFKKTPSFAQNDFENVSVVDA